MFAFHNQPAVKAEYLDRVKAHYKADEIIHGIYWQNGKGCAVGCTIHSDDHALYETELGIPMALARLEDTIFEGLTNGQAKEWPLKFLKAIKIGADLSTVQWKFLHWLQTENLKAAEKQKMPNDVIAAIKQCVDVLAPMAKGRPADLSAADSARSARSAARSAAYSARSAADSADSAADSARSAARSAAYSARSARSAAYSADSARSAADSERSAAHSAADSARSAARSAADSAARSADSARSAAYSADSADSADSAADSARSAAYLKMSEKLLELLTAAK